MKTISTVLALTALILPLATQAQAQVPAQPQTTDDVAAMRARNDRVQLANYPPDALRRGEEGVVGVDVTTDRQGRIMACQVARSSGFRALDDATCDFLFAHVKARGFLAPNGGGALRRQQGQVVWKLPPGRTPTAARPQQVAVGARPTSEKKICRAQAKTGSLVASQRICLTKAEWYRQYTYAQEETQDMKTHFQPGE